MVLISLLTFAVACGGDSGSGDPVYGGSSIYQEERNGQTVLVFDISITDADGDPYSSGILVEGAAFTPLASFPIAVPSVGGRAEIIVEVTAPGEYRVGIDGFTDTLGKTYLPLPDDENANGKVLLSQEYAP